MAALDGGGGNAAKLKDYLVQAVLVAAQYFLLQRLGGECRGPSNFALHLHELAQRVVQGSSRVCGRMPLGVSRPPET